MDAGGSHNAVNPRGRGRHRRNRGGTRGIASHPSAVDDGPYRNLASVSRELLLPDYMIAARYHANPHAVFRIPVPGFLRDLFPRRQIRNSREYSLAYELARRPRSQGSSAAPASEHPGAERTGSQTRVWQSVLYSDRPRGRRSQHRRPTEHLEHPSEVSNSELPAFDVLSVTDSSTAFPSETEEHPSEVKTTELGSAVTDLPTVEALSLMNELPLFIPDENFTSDEFFIPDETFEDSGDDDVNEEHISKTCSTIGKITDHPSENDTRELLDESDYEYDELPRVGGYRQTFLYFNKPKGLSRSMVLSADSLFITVSNDEEEQPKPESDVDSDEFEREMEEYFAANPCFPLRQAFDGISAIEHATLTAQAAEWGTESPSAITARAALEAQRQQETRSHQAPPQASAGAIERNEASIEDIVRKGRTWMCEEVMLCFKKYIERSAAFQALEYKLDELCHR